MGAVHVRTPKNFVLEERLERYADAIETNPELMPEIGARPVRPQAASPSSTFTWILAVARERTL